MQARSFSVAREGRSVDEHVVAAQRRRDEAEAAVFVPPRELAVEAHYAARIFSDSIGATVRHRCSS